MPAPTRPASRPARVEGHRSGGQLAPPTPFYRLSTIALRERSKPATAATTWPRSTTRARTPDDAGPASDAPAHAGRAGRCAVRRGASCAASHSDPLRAHEPLLLRLRPTAPRRRARRRPAPQPPSPRGGGGSAPVGVAAHDDQFVAAKAAWRDPMLERPAHAGTGRTAAIDSPLAASPRAGRAGGRSSSRRACSPTAESTPEAGAAGMTQLRWLIISSINAMPAISAPPRESPRQRWSRPLRSAVSRRLARRGPRWRAPGRACAAHSRTPACRRS